MNVTNIDEYLLHTAFEAMCFGCCHRWISVIRLNSLLKDLECPGCGETGKVINTGQDMS